MDDDDDAEYDDNELLVTPIIADEDELHSSYYNHIAS